MKVQLLIFILTLALSQSVPITIPLTSSNWSLAWGGNNFQYASTTNGQQMSWVGQPVNQCCSCGTSYDTYSTLVESKTVWARYFKLNVTASTPSQARTGNPPCAWEVFWLAFNWRWTTNPEKNSNYIIYKPAQTGINGGLELGTMSQSVGQTFLYTPGTLSQYGPLQIGQFYTYNIDRGFNNIKIGLNNVYYPAQPNTGLFDQLGSIMLYTEDAAADITSVSIDFYSTLTKDYPNATISDLAAKASCLEYAISAELGTTATKVILTGLYQVNSTTVRAYFYQQP